MSRKAAGALRWGSDPARGGETYSPGYVDRYSSAGADVALPPAQTWLLRGLEASGAMSRKRPAARTGAATHPA